MPRSRSRLKIDVNRIKVTMVKVKVTRVKVIIVGQGHKSKVKVARLR